ncbi:MAG TPA: twin-arginine translocase TatA/TatE family subunit [Planctomycetota bacterium]|jgi:sec-independent protein translocase protein TatA
MLPMLGFLQNMGPFEWIIILVICLLLFGHKLPSVARSLGSSVNEFKKGTREGDEEGAKTEQSNATAAPVSQLKCGNCGAIYIPGGPGAPCPNCKVAVPVPPAAQK